MAHMSKLLLLKLKRPPMGHVTRKRGEVWEVLMLYIICDQSGYVNVRGDKKFTNLERPKMGESSHRIAPDMPQRAQSISASCNEIKKYPAYEPIIVPF